MKDECGCLSEHAAFAIATFDGQHKPCTIVASHCSKCSTMYQTVIIDGHVSRDTLIEKSTRMKCTRQKAEQELNGMIVRAKQIGYDDNRLEPIMLPDLGHKPSANIPQPPAPLHSDTQANTGGKCYRCGSIFPNSQMTDVHEVDASGNSVTKAMCDDCVAHYSSGKQGVEVKDDTASTPKATSSPNSAPASLQPGQKSAASLNLQGSAPKTRKSLAGIGCGTLLLIIGVVGGIGELTKKSSSVWEEVTRPSHNISTLITMAILIAAGIALIFGKAKPR